MNEKSLGAAFSQAAQGSRLTPAKIKPSNTHEALRRIAEGLENTNEKDNNNA